MNVQAAPPTYTPVGAGQTPMGNPPVLGQQVPGMSGGLPAQGGLSVLANPLAQQLQSMGRDEDTMLVHMTPDEVNSLQGLAMAAGGSLTINPQTGLPEAGFLKKLLPMIAGIGLNFALPGAGMAGGKLVAALGGKAAAAGLLTGAASTALTGNLQKGLMAGLGAFGGASLAGGVQGALAKTAVPPPGGVPEGLLKSFSNSQAPVGEIAMTGAKTAAATAAPSATLGIPGLGMQAATAKAPSALASFGKGFADTARGSMTGLAAKAAPYAAGFGAMNTLSDATTPRFTAPGGQMDNSYEGPYTFEPREASYRSESPVVSRDSSPELFFQNSQPGLRNLRGELVQPGTTTAPGTMIRQAVLNPRARKGEPMYTFRNIPFMGLNPDEEDNRFAEGGTVDMRDGSFVLDARTVSEIGNGSSNAGIEVLSRMGGRPVHGPGDGVSDSVKASIGGRQEARVARDEVIFPPEAVRRMGGGSDARGTKKLYALMNKAHSARKKAGRGHNTKVAEGLGGLV